MASRQGECYAGIIVTFVAASVALTLRLYCRRLMGLRLALDDYLCIVAYFFASFCSGLMLYWTWYGLGRHIQDVHRPSAVIAHDSLLYLWILEFAYAYSLGFSKLSILSLYWRFFGLFRIRVPIMVLTCAVTSWLICRTFLTLFHCLPIQAFWDLSIKNAVCAINDSKFEFYSVLAHVVLDVSIFVLPIFQIQELDFRTLTERLAVCAIFMSGAFVCIVSIVNLTQLYAFLHTDGSSDTLWTTAPPALWGQVEINMAILAVSLPLMRPVIRKAFGTLASRHEGSSGTDTPGAVQPGWMHTRWIQKFMSSSSRTTATATTRPTDPEEAGLRNSRNQSQKGQASQITTPIAGPASARHGSYEAHALELTLLPPHVWREHDAF